jgi:hypothetical protein
MKVEKITIFRLYSIDQHGKTKFVGKYASYHRLRAAILANGLSKYFYETEDKPCEWGGTITLRGLQK